MAQRAGEKSRKPRFRADQGENLYLKPGFRLSVFWNGSMSNRDFS
jgi:hypothetical protein